MYALAWKRHSGSLHENLILCIKGLAPSIAAASRNLSTGPEVLPRGPSNFRASSLADNVNYGRIPLRSNCVSANCSKENAFKRTTSRARILEINPQLRNLADKRMIATIVQGVLPSPPYLQSRVTLGGAYQRKVGSLPFHLGFARCVSSGDRDDRGSEDRQERQQAIPLADGEGDEQDKEKERILSVQDVDEEVSSDHSKTEEFSGGEDDSENYRDQTDVAKEARARKVENEKERIVSEEATAEALFWAQKARFRKDFDKRIVDWESINEVLSSFPYYLSATTKELLLDCVAAHLRQPSFAVYGSGLPSSNRRILLNGQPGTELYQEKLVVAIARELQASLLIIDSTVLSPHDFGDQESSLESDAESSEESRFEDWDQNDSKWQGKDAELDSSNEETDETEADKQSDDESYKLPVVTLLGVTSDSADAIRRKLLEVFGGLVNVLEVHNHNASDSHERQEDQPEADFSVKKGDRVKYVGRDNANSSHRFSANNNSATNEGAASTGRQILKAGQRGRVVSVPKHMTSKVGVKFDRNDSPADSISKDEKQSEDTQKGDNLIEWCDLSELEPDDRPTVAHTEEWYAAIEALSEIAYTTKPLIIYLPDARQWFERAVSLEQRQEFLMQFEHKFDQIAGPVVIIAGRTSEEDSDKSARNRLKAHLEYIRHRLNVKSSTEFPVQEILGTEDIFELFVNTVEITPPQDEETLKSWNEQLVMHKILSQAKSNDRLLSKVLELHNMECPDLSNMNLSNLHLTTAKAENVVSWARNHLLASCLTPSTSNGKLMIPRDSLERALTRLRDHESKKTQPVTKDYKTAAEDEYEKALISAVIPPHEVGVKFDHIGSLEHVKQALRELVMLPLQRPELFAKGNLTRPCKGVLLFGPPGTGKTLLAKAVATEAGANFINITGSIITSKWFGDAEKLTKALFSLARKLSPAVIFVDEVDGLLGARGGSSEHEATRKTRNEFMAAWDGLRSKDNERVLVLAATNRPFDLDDAVIRRLPRRILVDLPTAENRVKILRVILAEEELEPNFDFEELARMTEGYSGSDLKNLSIAAAYRPIRELLDAEAKTLAASSEVSETGSPHFTRGTSPVAIRALRLDDFREGMTQVGASIAYDATSMNELRRWNEQYGEGGNRKRSSFGFTV
ncbi:unnamed protein product [Calypogeia fissa]